MDSLVRTFMTIVTIVIVISFFVAVVMIVVGLFGVVISHFNNSSNSREIRLLKKGIFIFIATVVFYLVIYALHSYLGLNVVNLRIPI